MIYIEDIFLTACMLIAGIENGTLN